MMYEESLPTPSSQPSISSWMPPPLGRQKLIVMHRLSQDLQLLLVLFGNLSALLFKPSAISVLLDRFTKPKL